MGRQGEKEALAANSRQGGGNSAESPAFGLLERWRASCRDWACRVYAFAVPHEPALAALAALGPLVEAGAGTGFWAK